MMMMGEPGIPKNAATILRSYASQIAAAGGLGWGFEALMSGLWRLEASVLALFPPAAQAMVEDP